MLAAVLWASGVMSNAQTTPDQMRTSGFDALRSGRYEEAEKIFNDALVLQPNDQQSLYGKALALFNLRKIDDAEEIARRSAGLALDSANEHGQESANRAADALTLLGVIQAVRGDRLAALESVKQAVKLSPRNFDAQFALGRAYYGLGRIPDAIQAFRQAVDLRTDHAQARFFLATSLERAGDSESALASYRELIKLAPQKVEGHLGAGVLLTKSSGAKLRDGIEELKLAIALNPDLYETRAALGKALIRDGRPDQAVEHLRVAARLEPNNPEPRYQLALAYKKLGKIAEANDEFAAVQKINADHRKRGQGSASNKQPIEPQ